MSQGNMTMKPEAFSRRHSSQSVRDKSAPSTLVEHAGLESHESGAYEVNTNVNTPRKFLQKLSPIMKFLGGKIQSEAVSYYLNIKRLLRQKV
jgi:hypothetical protein